VVRRTRSRGFAHRAALLPFLVFLPLIGCSGPASPRQNILLVTFDTTRADHVGAYGGPEGLTPVLDRLAAQGVRFTRAHAHSAVTPVSHASILTGLNPYAHGLRTLHGNRRYRLPDDVETLATRLAGDGYATAAFISAFPCGRRFGLDRGFALFQDDFEVVAPPRVGASGNVSTGLAQRRADATTDEALAWLAARAEGAPFFLWVHFFDPHDPLLRPPPSHVDRRMADFPEHARMEELLTRDPSLLLDTYADRQDVLKDWLRRLYGAEIAFADAQLGRLLAEIDGLGLAPSTLIAVTADHGEGLGDHGWWGHGILYQEQIHVPLILRGAGLPEGVAIEDPVRHVDLPATLLDLAGGLRFTSPVEGISLLPLIADRTAGRPPRPDSLPGPAYADSVSLMRYGTVFARDVIEEKSDQLYAWIDQDLKWIRHRLRPAEGELYDLRQDPGELRNLVAARPAEAARLDRDLERLRPMTEEIDFSLPDDPEVLERLRPLGYVGGPE
jgi:arylsulfatase A-like enzyme